jgi:hypothetical protein
VLSGCGNCCFYTGVIGIVCPRHGRVGNTGAVCPMRHRGFVGARLPAFDGDANAVEQCWRMGRVRTLVRLQVVVVF